MSFPTAFNNGHSNNNRLYDLISNLSVRPSVVDIRNLHASKAQLREVLRHLAASIIMAVSQRRTNMIQQDLSFASRLSSWAQTINRVDDPVSKELTTRWEHLTSADYNSWSSELLEMLVESGWKDFRVWGIGWAL